MSPFDMLSVELADGHTKTSKFPIIQDEKMMMRQSFPAVLYTYWQETYVLCALQRAFEDDDCVAVIEQSPNTADTRARPPGPGLVTVHMEPTFQDLQEDSLPAPDTHSVTVETYPEPILDTKV